MKREISAGGVVFRKSRDGIRVLLIRDSYGRWALPKGIVEKGETLRDAALREVREETGLKEVELLDRIGEIRYFYARKPPDAPSARDSHSGKVFKTSTFFLMKTAQAKLEPSWEIREAKWFGAKEAVGKIDYKNTKEIVKKAVRMAKRLNRA